MESISFRIPEQEKPGKESFDTRESAVQSWVEELPMGHTGETAKRLYNMLHEVNRLDISPGARAELMTLVTPPLHTVFSSLEHHYSGIPFPLPNKSLRVATLSTGLLRQVVIAYEVILDSEENASWLFRMTHTGMWLEAVHRILYYLGRILRNYQMIHRPVPAGVWQAIHKLYWAARDNRRHKDKVKHPLGNRTTTIEWEYKRALLLSMIEPQLLNREQMQQLYGNMPLWLKQADLVEADSRDEELVGYCIRSDSDAPHTNLTNTCCEECEGKKQTGLLLDLSGLGITLAGMLADCADGKSIRPRGGSEIARETLEVLHNAWHTPDKERLERIATDVPVEAAIGMSSIFQLLQNEVDSSARGISDQQMSDSLHELVQEEVSEVTARRQDAGTVMGSREDVWSNVFFATEVRTNAWSREADEREYRYIPAHQINYTDTGYCIEFDKSEVESLQIGELMGVLGSNDALPHLCMVRWLSDNDKRIAVGLMRLADSMEPALVVIHQGGQSTALYSLLGVGEDHKPQLFMPQLPGIREKELFLVVDETELPLTLHDRVVVSPLFDAFHFHAATIEADDEMSLEDVNKKLHSLTHPEEQSVMRDSGDFSDVWDSL